MGIGPTLAATSFGFVLVQLDVTIVNVALARIGGELGGDVASLQWIVDSYAIVFAALLLGAGALGDRIGPRRTFLGGLGLFTTASIGCGLAPGLGALVAARIAQGIGAAALIPCSLALLNHACRDDAERARAVGLWTAAGGLAISAGPPLGGALVDTLGWRSIFLVNLPAGLAGIWLTLRYTAEWLPGQPRGLDPPGQVLAIAALAGLAGAAIEGGKLGIAAPLPLALLGIGIAAAIAFVAVEARARDPMLPLRLLGNRTFSSCAAIGLAVNATMYGLLFVLSLFFQRAEGWTPLATGLAFLPMMAAVTIANVVGGRLAAARGPRLPMALGLGLTAAGYLLMAPAIRAGIPYPDLAWRFVLAAIGIGLAVPPMTAALLATVDRAQSGLAAGMLNTVRQAGGALGIALFGAAAHSARIVPGLRLGLFVCAALLAGTTALAIAAVRK